LKKARPSASFRRKGVLRFLPKEGRPSLPSGSFTTGGVAAFRRKRTSFGKLHLWRLSERRFTSGASFGKLHLWRASFRKPGMGVSLPSGRRPWLIRFPESPFYQGKAYLKIISDTDEDETSGAVTHTVLGRNGDRRSPSCMRILRFLNLFPSFGRT